MKYKNYRNITAAGDNFIFMGASRKVKTTWVGLPKLADAWEIKVNIFWHNINTIPWADI